MDDNKGEVATPSEQGELHRLVDAIRESEEAVLANEVQDLDAAFSAIREELGIS